MLATVLAVRIAAVVTAVTDVVAAVVVVVVLVNVNLVLEVGDSFGVVVVSAVFVVVETLFFAVVGM